MYDVYWANLIKHLRPGERQEDGGYDEFKGGRYTRYIFDDVHQYCYPNGKEGYTNIRIGIDDGKKHKEMFIAFHFGPGVCDLAISDQPMQVNNEVDKTKCPTKETRDAFVKLMDEGLAIIAADERAGKKHNQLKFILTQMKKIALYCT
jgi:hypothetical protein